MTSADQLRRLLHLIPQLADGEAHSLDEVARLARVDRTVILGDLMAISERFDEPGGFVEGLQIYLDADGSVSVVPNHFLRPMRLTRAELSALDLGLAMLRAERPPEEQRAIEGARDRLNRALAKLPVEDPADSLRTASLSPAGDPEHLRRLRAAFRGRRKVRLGYRKPAEERAEARVICPYAIVFANGMWYVVAHCETSEGIRFFRLDRIDSVEPLETRFPAPRDFSVDHVLREGRAFHAEGAGTLKVRYSARIARWIAEREGKTLASDGSLTLEHPLADLDWAVRHLLQYGPDVEVLEPAEVREAIVRRLRDIAQ